MAQSIAGVAGSSWEELVPYFWSDMRSVRIQLLGSATGADDVRIVHEDKEKKAFLSNTTTVGLIGLRIERLGRRNACRRA